MLPLPDATEVQRPWFLQSCYDRSTVNANKGKKSVFSTLEETLAVRNYDAAGLCFNFT